MNLFRLFWVRQHRRVLALKILNISDSALSSCMFKYWSSAFCFVSFQEVISFLFRLIFARAVLSASFHAETRQNFRTKFFVAISFYVGSFGFYVHHHPIVFISHSSL